MLFFFTYAQEKNHIYDNTVIELKLLSYFSGSNFPPVPEEHVLSDAVLSPVCDIGPSPGLPPSPPPCPCPPAVVVASHLRHPPHQPQHDG